MARFIHTSLILLLLPVAWAHFFGDWLNPPDTAQLILSNGYPVEEHNIVTEDGYILGVFRIPYGKNQKPTPNRPPVLVQHGVLCTSDCWVLSIPEKALGFRLADEGYDVWLGNNRGTPYSMKHVNMSSSSAKFWDFSFHELGYYDLPAMIDYILDLTSNSKITYIGHSQGTSQFFAMASTRPEYNSKMLVASTLAPIAFLDGTEGLVRFMSKFAKSIAVFARIFHINHVLNHNFVISAGDKLFCRPDSWFRTMCDNILYIVTGFDSPQLNKTLVEVIAQYAPAGASVKQLMHFAQLTTDGDKFCQYDYGKTENLKIYGQATPPDYNLTAITSPVVLHYANNDFLARPKNVHKLRELLSNPVDEILVPDDKFNHIDFMWAIDVNPLLYDNAIRIIKSFL